jgi:hypothetical protein
VEAPAVNAAIQCGPLPVGLGVAAGKGFGLRSGALGTYDTGELNILFIGYREFVPGEIDLDREKGYEFPYLWLPGLGMLPDNSREHGREPPAGKWFNVWQFEAALGLGAGIRAGVNLAEIVDFVLGWTTLDICGDDVAVMDEREQREFRKTSPPDGKTPQSPPVGEP